MPGPGDHVQPQVLSGAEPTPQEMAKAQRERMVRWVRMGFLVLFSVITAVYVLEPLQKGTGSDTAVNLGWWTIAWAVMIGGLVYLLDILTPNKRITMASGLLFGLLAGLLITWAFSSIIDLLINTYDIKAPTLVSALKVLLGVALVFLSISIVLQTQDDFRLVIPYVEFTKQYRGSTPLVLDTSALIDGRIADIAQTGFIQVPLVIPEFVVRELQTLADSGDRLKRARGRRGLEMITRLQRTGGLDVTIDATPPTGTGVDQQLVELAVQLPAGIVTADTGLNRVATIRGVSVLNLNDLGNALKPTLVVGSSTAITLVRPGEQPGQAVGFLDDGTMVVVDAAAERVGDEVTVEVTGNLQTSAGRLVFARLPAARGSASTPPSDNLGVAAAPDPAPAGGEMEGEPAAPTIGAPVTVRPPESAPAAKSPFPPARVPHNPARNPRR